MEFRDFSVSWPPELAPNRPGCSIGYFSEIVHDGIFVATLEKRQGVKMACQEEITWRQGLFSDSGLEAVIAKLGNGNYRNYLRKKLAQG